MTTGDFKDGLLRLPLHWRIYFVARKALVDTLRLLIWCGTKTHWSWLVAATRSVKRRLALRF